MRSLLLCLPALLCVAAPGPAQKRETIKRPQLDAGADTNDAGHYYNFGLRQLSERPERAAAAFYWATRLNPAWAEPYYARGVALHLSNPKQLVDYVLRDRYVLKSKHVQRIDSLWDEALLRNPLLHRRLDGRMIDRVITELSEGDGRRRYIYLTRISSDPYLAGRQAYIDGNFAEAVDHFARAIEREKEDYWLYWLYNYRARTFYHLTHFDSAAASFTALLGEMRGRDMKDVVVVYRSKALVEYSLATMYFNQNKTDQAVEALGRALVEDMSFYMAHVRLGQIAEARGDTATALQELQLAVELRGDDATVRYLYGKALVLAGRIEEALPQLRAAVEHEPYYAPPYFLLARLHDVAELYEDAIRYYEQYVALAAQSMSELAPARARLAEVQAKHAAERAAHEAQGAASTGASAEAPAAAPAAASAGKPVAFRCVTEG